MFKFLWSSSVLYSYGASVYLLIEHHFVFFYSDGESVCYILLKYPCVYIHIVHQCVYNLMEHQFVYIHMEHQYVYISMEYQTEYVYIPMEQQCGYNLMELQRAILFWNICVFIFLFYVLMKH